MVAIFKLVSLAAVTLTARAYDGTPDSKKACSVLAKLSIPDVTINIAEYLAAGTNLTLSQDYNLTTCNRPYQVVYNDLCRVAMKVATSNRSEITLEAWLPTNWTGRFLSTGNGGESGCIQYEDIAYAASYGFATVGANNGHNGTSGLAFYNNPDVVTDFSWRSVHTGVVIGKQITKEYYGSPFTKSYYLGCSTGGRQGMKSVQDFPEDFDGVVAGAPGIDFNNLNSWSNRFFAITGRGNASSPAYIPLSYWPFIHAEILNQCDALDGAVDGLLEDADLCPFRAEALQCAPEQTANCLTGIQVNTINDIFSPYYGLDGTLIYPRTQLGSEIVNNGFYTAVVPSSLTADWFRYAVYDNPLWDPATMSLEDVAYAAAKNPSNIASWNGDISAFQKRGGKLLHYQGLQDAGQNNSPRYYNLVSRTMSLPSASLDDFYRYFRISGMGHCSGGPGAWEIGQKYIGITTPDPQHNILMRIVAWVENGEAPETVTGIKYVNDTQALGISIVRDHCKYPKRNFCFDPKSPSLATSWKCI